MNNWIRNLSALTLTLSVSSCVDRPAQVANENQAKLAEKINNAHPLSTDLKMPLLTEGAIMSKVSLEQAIASAIANRRSVISIRNDSLAFEDMATGLRAFRNKDAGCIKTASFIKFPFTDSMIEPLQASKITNLQLRLARLKDLHALKGMNGLQSLDVSGNPLNSEGMRVIATLKGLKSLLVNNSGIHDSDLRNLSGLTNLTSLNLNDCTNLTAEAVNKLRKTLPSCRISYAVAPAFSPGRRRLAAALACKADGLIDDAIAVAKRVIQDLDSQHSQDYLLISQCHELLGQCYAQQKQQDRANAEQELASKYLQADKDVAGAKQSGNF